MTGDTKRLALNVDEAALEAGVGREAIYSAIRDGKLEARKLGRRTIITYRALEQYLEGMPLLQLPPRSLPSKKQNGRPAAKHGRS